MCENAGETDSRFMNGLLNGLSALLSSSYPVTRLLGTGPDMLFMAARILVRRAAQDKSCVEQRSTSWRLAAVQQNVSFLVKKDLIPRVPKWYAGDHDGLESGVDEGSRDN